MNDPDGYGYDPMRHGGSAMMNGGTGPAPGRRHAPSSMRDWRAVR